MNIKEVIVTMSGTIMRYLNLIRSERGFFNLCREQMYHKFNVAWSGQDRARVQQKPRYNFMKSL